MRLHVQETESLEKLARLTRQVMLGTTKLLWAPPISKPHISMAYSDHLDWMEEKVGWSPEGAALLRNGFACTEVCILQTNRRCCGEPLNEYVAAWREIARETL